MKDRFGTIQGYQWPSHYLRMVKKLQEEKSQEKPAPQGVGDEKEQKPNGR
jgi:hypothetical protein